MTQEEFINRMRAFMTEETIAQYEKYPVSSSIRFDGVIISLQRYARYEPSYRDIPSTYACTADGISWAVNSGRVNGETHTVLKAMPINVLLTLVHRVHENCTLMNEIPAYLMSQCTTARV